MPLVERFTPGGNLYPDGSSTFVTLVDLFRRIAETRDELDKKIGAAVKPLNTADLDTITTTGKYLQDYAGNATLARHYPHASFEGPIYVDSWGGKALQVAYSRAGSVFQRAYNGTVWGDWMTLTTVDLTGVDLNTLTRSCLAVQGTPAQATLAMNYPWAEQRATIQVIGNGTYAVQTVDPLWNDNRAGHRARREYRAGTWTPWVISGDVKYATEAYVGNAVAGALDPAERRATLYPVTLKVGVQAGSGALTALDTGDLTTIDLETAANNASFFNVPVTRKGYGNFGEGGMAGPWGMGQATYCGVTTTATTLIFGGIHGSYRDRVMFLIDGEPIDADQVVTVNLNGYSSWRLTFPDARSRTVEMYARFAYKQIKYTAGANFAPYARTGKYRKVGILGDSWVDGTTQAPRAIGTRLGWHGGYDLAVSALGGTGYVRVNGSSVAYSDPSRIGPMASWAPEVCVLWGSINDKAHTPSEVQAAGQSMIDQLKAARPGVKILLTGQQTSTPEGDAYRPAYTALAANNTGVTFVDSSTAFPNSTGPHDGIHPSPTGAKRVAEWLIKNIDAL